MKILFIVTGVGYGDAIREHINIMEFLSRDKKNKVMVAGYDNSYNYFKSKYKTIRIKGYKFVFKAMKFRPVPFIAQNILLPLDWLRSTISLKKQIKSFNPDLIVSDFEPIGILLAKMIKKKCLMIFGFDPDIYKIMRNRNINLTLESKFFELFYSQADDVIIPTLLGQKKNSKHHSVNPIIRTLPKDLPDKGKLMKTLNIRRDPVIVMLGGSSYGKLLVKKILEMAKNIDEDFIIFGTSYRFPKRKNILHYPFKPNFLEYLKVSKAVITLAGNLTLTECIVFKKPMIIFPIKYHVEQQMNAFVLKNVAMIMDDANKFKQEELKHFLKNIDRFKKKIPNIKCNGAKQAVDIMYRLAKQ